MGIVCTEITITNTLFSMFVVILNEDASKGRDLALSLGVLGLGLRTFIVDISEM